MGFPNVRKLVNLFYFKILFIHFREGREKERERNINCVVASRVSPPGSQPAAQACALDWESNQRPFGSQASGTQSIKPHQLGLLM